jgi:hypothetical protein
MPADPGRARVRFDTHALADDLDRHSPPGPNRAATRPRAVRAKACHSSGCGACKDEHRAGTSLPGCVKVYLPDRDGDRRMIFQIATDEAGPLLRYLACGVGHQPRGTRAPTPTGSPTIAFTADGPGDRCRDAPDAAPNDPHGDAQRPGRRPETQRRLDSWGPTAAATLQIKSRSHQAVANAVAVATRVEAVAGRWARRLPIAG